MIISIQEAQRLTSPNPFALVGTCDAQGKQNFMALSWWTYVSNHPASLAVCTSNLGYTGRLIRETGEFTLNIVGKEQAQIAVACGRSTGAKIDKVKEFEIPVFPSTVVSPMCIEGSRVCFECQLTDHFPAGDHTIYVGQIAIIHASPSVPHLYAFEGYQILETIDPSV